MKYKNILFDLDGTLIDSAPGIEESFHYAYKHIYKEECKKDIKSLIGPSIDQVLKSITLEDNVDIIKSFVNEFKNHYDSVGYLKTKLYPEVETVIETLLKNNLNLFIATNKREKPTKLILEHFSILSYFKEIYCSDSFDLSFSSKTELVTNLMKQQALLSCETLMVGDTIHDGTAANSNSLDFVLVEYGYGNYKFFKYKINNLSQLLNIF